MSRTEEFHFGAAHMGRLTQYRDFHNKTALVNIQAGYGVQNGEMTVPEQQEVAKQVSGVQKAAMTKLNVPSGKPQKFVGNRMLKDVPSGKHAAPSGPRQRPKYN